MQNAPLKGGHHGKSNRPALGRTGGRPPDGGAGGADTCFRAEYRLTEGLWRLYAVGRQNRLLLGCRGRTGYPPAAILPAADGGAGSAAGRGSGAGIRPEDWRPVWAGEFPGLALPEGALCRRAGRRRYLALPFREDGPFPLTGLFCLASVRTLRGRSGPFLHWRTGRHKKFTFMLPYLVGMWYTTPKLADYPPKNGRRKHMRCPYCGFRESKVVDSRPADEGSSIRRRRECLSCEKRFTTYETVESLPMVVIKKDGSRQSFDRSKILRGIQRSCEKRCRWRTWNAWPVRSSRSCRTPWSGRSAPRSSARRSWRN